MVKLFLSFVLGSSALRCGPEQRCKEYSREKTILLSCLLSAVGMSWVTSLKKITMEETSQNLDAGKITSILPQFTFGSCRRIEVCFIFASSCCLALPWVSTGLAAKQRTLFSLLSVCWFPLSPLNGSHWIGAGLKHHQQHSSFGSVKVNELTVMGLRVLAFTSSFYSSVLKSTINKDVLKVLSLDAVSFPYCLKKSKQWCSYLIMSSCYHMTSNINWKGKSGTSAWLNILESNNCVHFIAPCSPARGEKLFPSSFKPNQTIHHVVRFSCEQHSSTRWNNTLC